MPTTRAARSELRHFATPAARFLFDSPSDVLGHVLYQLPLAHDIAAVAPTCHLLCSAATLARSLRPFSSQVVTLAGTDVQALAVLPDGRVITTTADGEVKFWRDGVCERTIAAHAAHEYGMGKIHCVAVLPGGARFVTCADDRVVKLWTLDGVLERTFQMITPDTPMGIEVLCVAALPDGVHFVVGLANKEVRLYHVNGALVHAFKGHRFEVRAVAVTPDGQHIISGSYDSLVKVWSVASKSLVSTCNGHTDFVVAVAAMPDGKRILSGGHDNTVRVWLLDGTLKNTFAWENTGWVEALVASTSGSSRKA